jgi:hypothetical protein
MRTPKIQSLYQLIDWLNLKQNFDSSIKELDIKIFTPKTIVKLPLNSRNKYRIIECRFKLDQSQKYYNGACNYKFMPDITTFFNSSLKKNYS